MGSNKLFCTFIAHDELENTLDSLIHKYTILYSKIFVLESLSSDEFICTYNIDTLNMEQQSVLPNTILLHRKKESNSLRKSSGKSDIVFNSFTYFIVYN